MKYNLVKNQGRTAICENFKAKYFSNFTNVPQSVNKSEPRINVYRVDGVIICEIW